MAVHGNYQRGMTWEIVHYDEKEEDESGNYIHPNALTEEQYNEL
jgi:hypothetical protein